MNFLYPIYTEQTECQDCYKCIRHCPAKAILVENGHAKIIPEQCIMCGTCVINCPAKAKRIRNDLPKVRQLLQGKEKVFVSLAPSFASEFPEFTSEQLIHILKSLGFYAVSETALGADFVSCQIAKDLQNATENLATSKKQKLFLSSACPAVVEFIKQCKSELAPYITDRASPLLAHSRFLKKEFGSDIKIVFIGPCIAKKREADTWKNIDAALTFNDLRQWMESENISNKNIICSESDVFVPQRSAKGALYPIDGGMIRAFSEYTQQTSDSNLKNFNTMTISGIEQIDSALSGLNEESLQEPLFIELLACSGGCVNGPGSYSSCPSAIKSVRIINYAKSSEKVLSPKMVQKLPEISGTLPKPDFKFPSHSEREITLALRSVGKYGKSDELNCATCGYDTCRQFAMAMLDHRAEKTMCVSYMKKLAQKKANSLIKTIPSGVVIADKNLLVVECNQNFADMMGEEVQMMYAAMPGLEGARLDMILDFSSLFSRVLERKGPDSIEKEVQHGKNIFHVSVFSIEKEEIAGCVIDDVTAPQIQRHRIVAQAQKVINKNLSTVQKIAFLLGENAAESEAILNSIIKSFSDEDKQ